MCIVLVTTAHPSYQLIILDNRDEFILRPTSRPHWWVSENQEILSARDLQRAEQGTWLGITKTGNFAVLTNFREVDINDANHPVQGLRSRGGMVTAWLTAPNDESTEQFVYHLLEGDGVKGVGGFSLLCGKLRNARGKSQEAQPLAIISNRSGSPDDVPWVAERRGEVYGLSNTCYDDPIPWPKIEMGKEKVLEAVGEVVRDELGEEELIEKMFAVLDHDTLPRTGQDLEDYIFELRKSIFIPSIGSEESPADVLKADQIASGRPTANGSVLKNGISVGDLKEEETPRPEASSQMTGIYGTQRQTVILVDWEGKVTFRERPLYDDKGHPIKRGEGDMNFEFKIDGWNGEKNS